MSYKDKEGQRKYQKDWVRQKRKGSTTPRNNEEQTTGQANVTVSQPRAYILKNMKACNYSNKYYIPTKRLNEINPNIFPTLHENREKKPTKEEVNKYP